MPYHATPCKAPNCATCRSLVKLWPLSESATAMIARHAENDLRRSRDWNEPTGSRHGCDCPTCKGAREHGYRFTKTLPCGICNNGNDFPHSPDRTGGVRQASQCPACSRANPMVVR